MHIPAPLQRLLPSSVGLVMLVVCRLVPALMIPLVLLAPLSLPAQGFNLSSRQLPEKLVPTPDQLLQKLSRLQGVDLPTSPNEQLMELGEKILSEMSPQQQKYLQELARQFQQGREPRIPPELKGLAENFQRQMLKEGQSLEFEDLLKELPQGWLPPASTPNGNPDSTLPERAGNSRTEPRREPRRDIPERDRTPSPAAPPRAESEIPGPRELFDPEEAKRIAERLRDSISELPDNESYQPDPDWFEPEREPRFSADDSGEYIGNRFDRMIMEAVENQLNRSDESRSRMADAVGDMFSGLVDRVHSRINEKDWSSNRRARGIGQQLHNQIRSRSESPSGGGFWRRFGSATPGDGLGGISGGWLLGLLLLAAMVACIWLMRKSTTGSGGVTRLFGGRSFRLPRKIRTADELVQAVDGFLLGRFGKPSSWWHSRRAEAALCYQLPNKGPRISQLVNCYEYARYSEVGESLSSAQIEECTAILHELASSHPQVADANETQETHET